MRKGKHTVAVAEETIVHESAVAKFVHELKEGIAYIKLRPRLLLLGIAWALFIGGMLTQGVITAPFSDRILKSGAVGYGWLNAGWAIGAFMSAIYTPALIRGTGHRRAVGISMALLGLSLISLPFLGSHIHGAFAVSASLIVGKALAVCAAVYCLMGCCRALGGVAITSTMMELVPKHFMGRVQNTFYFLGTLMQLAFSFIVGTVSHTRGLGARIRDCRRNLSAGMPHRFVAGKRCGGGDRRQAGTRELTDLQSADLVSVDSFPVTAQRKNCCGGAVFA